jgi:signal transduction histidine kinase
MTLIDHWWLATKTILVVVCIGLAGLSIFIASKRWQTLALPMVSFAVFMLSVATLLLLSNASTTVLNLFVGTLAAAAGALGALTLSIRIGSLMAQPTHEQMREMNAALERANRELEAFTASVSHDLRSPLTTIAGQAGLLEMSAGTKLDDDQKRRLHRIQASVKQMSELIEALLNLSRIAQVKLEREMIDISATAAHIVNDLAQRDPERRVDVRIAPGLMLYGDRRLITCALENLLSNAWKFTSKTQDAHIEVGAVEVGHHRRIYVRDNGCGFDMTHHDKLFQPFHRLHSHREFPGSGVGLATASRIIARHGGRLWAESKPQEGATFWFTVG